MCVCPSAPTAQSCIAYSSLPFSLGFSLSHQLSLPFPNPFLLCFPQPQHQQMELRDLRHGTGKHWDQCPASSLNGGSPLPHPSALLAPCSVAPPTHALCGDGAGLLSWSLTLIFPIWEHWREMHKQSTGFSEHFGQENLNVPIFLEVSPCSARG